MSPAVAIDPAIKKALASDDFGALTPEQRGTYVQHVCDSLGLNPLTKPFEYVKNRKTQKLNLYATKNCGEQLRRLRGVNITELNYTIMEGVVIFTVRATDSESRTDVGTGAASIEGLVGEERANAIMKAETKAKRRVTLSLCGLGMLDETEIEPDTFITRVQADATPLVETPEISTAPAEQGTDPRPASGLKPSQEQLDIYKARAGEIRRRLEDAGLQPSQGVSTGNKLVRFFTKASNVNTPKDLTLDQWDERFGELEQYLLIDAKKAVERIEDVIK